LQDKRTIVASATGAFLGTYLTVWQAARKTLAS